MTSEDRFEKNRDAFTEISTYREMTPEDREYYCDEMLRDLCVAAWPTSQQQDN